MAGVGWGKGKREVIALKAEILALLASGATLKEAHDVLRGAGRLTLGYTAFTIAVKAIRKQEAAPAAPPVQPIELTPEVMAWLASVPRTPPASLPTSHPSTQLPGPPAEPVGKQLPLPSAAATPRRTPIGAGVEPAVRKFDHYRSGEKDHWDDETTTSNQGDDRK